MRKAIIIGAGPAGLTAAYELLKRTDIKPIIIEKSGDIGGISKTINYKGNRMDIGGHRFFSKSDRVMNWWLNIMPLEQNDDAAITLNYQNKTTELLPNKNKTATASADNVMLVRSRLSRIYFLRHFFTYPLKLSADTLKKLGYKRSAEIIFSYIKTRLHPVKPEKNLEDFFINKFGNKLYRTFFKDYTEKVWGIGCKEIPPEWGAQRLKGVSISKAVLHAFRQAFKKTTDIHQKDLETSLIEKFLYPKYGPGQLWEEVARQIKASDGEVLTNQNVSRINVSGNLISSIEITNNLTGEITLLEADYFFSSMPVKELVNKLSIEVPENISRVANGLMYRDFITIGVLLNKWSLNKNALGKNNSNELKDNWIYIQESDVKVGRLQIFNNWSPFMVNNKDHIWIGMEYFCQQGDELWMMEDEHLKDFATSELQKIGLIKKEDVLDSTIVRMEKAYPAYFGTYNEFDVVKDYLTGFENLFLVGRNGMHKYNNSDHSMLTAMTAVDNICNNKTDKQNIWDINTEQEYHETKK